MKLQKVQLKNFKRFTDLTIDKIPSNAKLVLLIGSNGSGKSSVFDAFCSINNTILGQKLNENYYKKQNNLSLEVILDFEDASVELSNLQFSNSLKMPPIPTYSAFYKYKNPFYGRTSFRQVSRLSETLSGSINIAQDNDRPHFFIDSDSRFKMDVPLWLEKILTELFDEKSNTDEILAKLTNPINQAFENIFGKDSATSLRLKNVLPQRNGESIRINFEKGDAEFSYDFLSAGEKEVFGILLNLLVRRNEFQDTIYFFDEIDLHLHTSLQTRLLKEITENWIPENCQIWTASHSLGFIEYAQESENAVIIDFDDLDFDVPQVLIPTDKTRYEVFEIAVSKEFIDKVFQGRKIFFAENTDVPLYNDLSIENTFFFNAIDKADVFHKSKNLNTFGLIDRDFLTDDEILQIQQTYLNIKVLTYYSIENLLFHPENLAEYFAEKEKDFDIDNYKKVLTEEKNNQRDYIVSGIFNARAGYPFFKENEYVKELKTFRENSREIIDLLRSDDFETFYKVFPAKDYGKSISERQNLNKKDLAKTKWFKLKIENLLKN
jgi:hypothetical protein